MLQSEVIARLTLEILFRIHGKWFEIVTTGIGKNNTTTIVEFYLTVGVVGSLHTVNLNIFQPRRRLRRLDILKNQHSMLCIRDINQAITGKRCIARDDIIHIIAQSDRRRNLTYGCFRVDRQDISLTRQQQGSKQQ